MANTPALSTAEVGEVFQSRTNQLAAVLSLLNTYVPGSYLLESQCLHFLGRDNYNGLSKRLFKTTPKHGRADKEVRIAHTQYCTELLAKAGVTRSDTTRTFLNNFCKDQISPWLFGFVKNMLTTRKMKKEVDRVNSRDIKKERFSRLILDIQMKEGNEQCATVLEEASNTFDQDPFFPQALARFYYIELEDYEQAEMWAAEALKRDPQNSFIADTLGQVHKNHLMNDEVSEPREILRLAQKAIEAFEEEEKLAEVEDGPGMKKQGNTINYYRGQFGYLQVCNTLYDKLVSKNETWKNVLTREESMTSVCTSLEGENLLEFSKLIENLRDEVEEKCIFLKQFLTYSRPNKDKDVRRPCHHDPKYISDDTSECYQKYVGDTTANQLIEMFKKRNLDDQSVEVLSFLVKQYTQSELIEIFTKCRESATADSETALVNNILTPFRRKMPPSDTDPRELHMFTLLWYWPENEGHCDYDLRELTQKMYNEIKYVKYFRNRYFLPVFFIGKGEGVKRIVHRNVIEKHLKVRPDRSNNWKNERIFRNPGVKELLLRLKGEVKNLRVYTRVGSKEIEIDTNVRNKNWKSPSVTFYLGFTIRGPVAFDIQNKTRQRVRKRNSETAVNSTCLL